MNFLKMIVPVTVIICSGTSLADSWTITQSVTVDTNTDVLQDSTSSNSVQTLNSINLNGTNGVLNTGSTQNLNIQDNNLELEQGNTTASSSQAVNRVYAKTISGIQQDITTSGAALSAITLDQKSDIGDNNYQSINSAVTSNAGQIDELTQAVGTTGHYVNFQQLGGTTNVQAGNLITSGNLSTTTDAVTQSLTVTNVAFTQRNTVSSLQAGNALLIISGQSGGKIKQESTSSIGSGGAFTYLQSSTSGSVQSINYSGDEL